MAVSRWLRGAGLCAASLFGCSTQVDLPPRKSPPVQAENVPPPWSLAEGALPAGFETEGNVGVPIACSAVRSDGEGFDAGQIAEVGGDYWKVPLEQGPFGTCWIRTSAEAVGRITSSQFLPTSRWLSFFLRRTPESRTSVELRQNGVTIAKTPPDLGGARFLPVLWDLDALVTDKTTDCRVELVIVDEDPEDNLCVADVSLSRQRPVMPASVHPQDRLWGFADLHAHLFTPMAFGGQLFWGNVHSAFNSQGYSGTPGASDPRRALGACTPMHGTGPQDGVLFTMPPEGAHNRGGFPGFVGFSHFRTVYHQQAYVDSIKRAWQGGLRLLQADAVNYEFLETVYRISRPYTPGVPKNPTSDAWNIEHQVKAARALASMPDVAAFAGVALSAGGARSLIQSGKLAIVLGTEVETLGPVDAALAGVTDERVMRELIEPVVACLHERGVRHVIPIHLGENAFGAPAVYDVMFDLGNEALRKNHFALRATTREEGIFYSRDADWRDQGPGEKLIVGLGLAGLSAPPDGPAGGVGQAHAGGLTPAGRIAIEELMRRGMIVDMEHASHRSEEAMLTLAEKHGYPIIASHTGFLDTSLGPQEAADPQSWATERAKSKRHLERLRALGGLVGVGTSRGPTRVADGVAACDGGTPAFLTEMRYAIQVMGGAGVALGTDINGLGQQSDPRFGPFACWSAGEDKRRVHLIAAQREAQMNGVAYSEQTPLQRHDWQRFDGDDKSAKINGKEAFLTQDQRHTWLAIARHLAGHGERLDAFDGDPQQARKLARGFFLAGTGARPTRSDVGDSTILAGYWGCMKAAPLCLGKPAPTDGAGPAAIAGKVAMVADTWRAWSKMTGTNERLRRSRIGEADYDYNIDGLAHYGMLPDLLQDAKNLGLTEGELSVLFQSAGDFVAMWEKAEAAAARVAATLPPSICQGRDARCTCAAQENIRRD